jgi:hypothetical protein
MKEISEDKHLRRRKISAMYQLGITHRYAHILI